MDYDCKRSESLANTRSLRVGQLPVAALAHMDDERVTIRQHCCSGAEFLLHTNIGRERQTGSG